MLCTRFATLRATALPAAALALGCCLIAITALLVGVAPASAEPQAQERWQPMPIPEGCAQLAFSDEDNGWAGAPISVTDDGGLTWTVVRQSADQVLDIDASSPDEAWALCADGSGWHPFVLHTSDGGDAWQTYDLDLAGVSGEGEIEFVDSLHGFLTIQGKIYSTEDGGDTWVLLSTPFSAMRISFVDDTTGWALSYVGWDPVVWSTTDGGEHWSSIPLPASVHARYEDVALVDSLHAFVITEYGSVVRTADGGLTWQSSELHSDTWKSVGWALCAADAERVWAGGSSGDVYATDDGGVTWFKQAGTYWPSMQRFDMVVDGDRGWIVGQGGRRTDLSGFSDMRPPVTTSDAPAIMTGDTEIHLQASDLRTGVASTWYRYGSMGWQEGTTVMLPMPAPPSYGVIGLEVASSDRYGNWEEGNEIPITYDTLGPNVTFDPLQPDSLDQWTNRDARIGLGADDAAGGKAAGLQVRRDGGAWTPRPLGYVVVTKGPSTHANDGIHELTARALDDRGNLGPEQTHLVGIDTRRPTAAAAYVGRATAGGTGKVRFRISDPRPCSEACRVRITITTLKGRRLGYLAPDVWFKTGRYITVQFACPIKAGKYRFVVKGIDGADNPTARTAGNYLVVSKSRSASRGASPRVWEFRSPGERAPFAPAARAVTPR